MKAIPCRVIGSGGDPWYRPLMGSNGAATVGHLLREWRQRRRMSQLDLASLSGVTTRHLSFVETGRARPSREMVLHLAEHLDVPLRDRNALLLAAGFAPTFRHGDLNDESFDAVREAIDRLLASHDPFPAMVVDRRWHLVSANSAAFVLSAGVDPALLEPPVNVMRAALHPDGLGRRIANIDEWSNHLIGRLRRQALLTADEELDALADELQGYARALGVEDVRPPGETAEIATPMLLDTPYGRLALLSTLMTFGTALDITLSELALETFLPADRETAERLNELARVVA
jgi:transcriptional regulator with XRE-family HTH domain